MAIFINLRHLEEHGIRLQGEISPADLDLETLDEMIHVKRPLAYDLEVQKLDQALLIQGRLGLTIDCECVRCLKPFEHKIDFDHWVCHIPLEGEDKAPVTNDLVDLTPYVREDIVLAFPQHPLCKVECGGLVPPAKDRTSGGFSGAIGFIPVGGVG
jgi:uncharacterized protein